MNVESASEQVLSVSELTQWIKQLLEDNVGEVWVEGEISNHRQQSSGHHYFTLKDAGAQIACVMFRGQAGRYEHLLADGLKIKVCGELSVYEPRGQYQMVVRQVKAKGKGGLHEQFEALKQKLFDLGWFDEERKKSIVEIPKGIVIVTSPTGAALQDILNILRRRAPYLKVWVYEVKVQGQEAAREIVAAIRQANQDCLNGKIQANTLLVTRGGGSIEDMWCFNDENVARAILESDLPVISAIGHEIDFTIADFVADLRAPTPSAAAELIAIEQDRLFAQLEYFNQQMRQFIEYNIQHWDRRLSEKQLQLNHLEPRQVLQRYEQQFDEMEWRMGSLIKKTISDKEWALKNGELGLQQCHPQQKISQSSHQLELWWERMERGISQYFKNRKQKMEFIEKNIELLDPHQVLERGYTLTTLESGEFLKATDQVNFGDRIITQLAFGKIESTVYQRESYTKNS
jgi:exodeoxyribonuclease VII large subunit